jgi:hypothetical protein
MNDTTYPKNSNDRPVSSTLSSRWCLPLVALIVTVLCLPFIRTIFGMGDEAILLNGAERMLQGRSLYVDFFEFLPPGGFILTEAWFSIAGISVGSARSLAILTIVGIACFTYLVCWQASKNAPLSVLLTTAWVVMSQGPMTQVSHHWISTLFSMAAAWAALADIEYTQRRPRWPLIAGVAAGMAAMVVPHRGLLVMLAAATSFLNLRRELIVYWLGCALIPTALLTYLAGHHAIKAAFDDVVRLTAERYSAINIVPFGLDGQNDPLTYLFPLAALLALLVCALHWRLIFSDRVFWQCAAFGLAGFVGCFPRPDIIHIGFAVPLVCPLLACCMTRLAQRWHSKWWRFRYLVVVIAGVVIGLCVPSVLFFSELSLEALRANLVPTPRGNVKIFGPLRAGAPELLVRIAATPPGDEYFFYPVLSKLSFLAAREQVSKYDFFLAEYTLPSEYQDACFSVMRHASWVVIDRRWTPSVLKQWYPAMHASEPQATKRFERALDVNFDLVAQEGAFELRRRRESSSDKVCAGIAE